MSGSTLLRCLCAHAKQQPDKNAFTFLVEGREEARLSFRELESQARAVGLELTRRRMVGRRVLLCFPPGFEFIVAFLGCLYAGAVAVPTLPPRRRNNRRIKAIVEDCAPEIVLGTRVLAGRAAGLREEIEGLRDIPWLHIEELLAVDPGEWQPPEHEPSTLAFLQYTSGSTSTPKGVMVSHHNLASNEAEMKAAFGVTSSSRIVSWLPLYHDMGLIGGVLQPVYSGASCVLFSPVSFLQRPVRWLEAISRYGATISGAPDFAYDLCARRIPPEEVADLDLSSWAVAFNGSEPVRAQTLERFARAFAEQGFDRRAFYPCYGLAEATLFVSGGTPGDGPVVETFASEALAQNRAEPLAEEGAGKTLVSSGRRTAGGIHIVDPESLRSLGDGEVGEIWLSGESMARGYWNRPEQTAETFHAHPAQSSSSASGEGFLRTGDLGFLRDGELFVSGRLKDLIILRGRNLYPQDLEATAEEAHPDLRPGGGIAFSVTVDGEERVVVVHEVDRRAKALDEIGRALVRTVAEEHEVAVHEVVLIQHGTVPKTSSGKLQRRACRSLYLEGGLRVVEKHRPAVSWEPTADGPVETFDRAACLALTPGERGAMLRLYLREQLAQAVGLAPKEVAEDEPLIRLLLDSLRLVELVHRVSAELGVRLDLSGLFEGTTLGDLAEEIAWGLEGDADEAFASAPVVEGADRPLTLGQAALWFVEGLAPESGVHHLVAAARVESALDAEALRDALGRLVARHEALRTTFELVAGEPVRRVHRQLAPDFEVLEEAATEERLRKVARRPFDLACGPLVRVCCFEGEDGMVVLWVVHHLVIDFWSMKVLMEELATLYPSGADPKAELPVLDVSYEDHVAAQGKLLEGARGQALRDFWWAELHDAPRVLELPTDRARPRRRGFRGGAVSGLLGKGLGASLEDLARSEETTLFTTLLAALQVLLARLSGQNEVLVGTPAANRSAQMARVVGYFVNPVVVRGELAGARSFSEVLGATRRRVLGALAHQEYPFPELTRLLETERETALPPVAQVLFVLQRGGPEQLGALALGVPGARVHLGELELESVAVEPFATDFDLALYVADVAGELHASLRFDTDLFDRTTVQRIFNQWCTLLHSAVSAPEREVAALELLRPAEQHQLLVEWQASLVGQDPADLCLHGLFEEAARRWPENVAVVAGRRELSYGALNGAANALARVLVERGVGPEERVGILLERKPELLIAVLAVLKAGAAYVPLDPTYPAERLGLMVDDSAARWVLTDGGGAASRIEFDGVERLELSDLLPPGAVADDPEPRSGPDQLAYLIYTSGSTGRPKGVAIPHRPAVRLLRWAGELFPELAAEVLAATSICFDLSIFEIFGPLSQGGTVVLVDTVLEVSNLPADRAVRLVNTVPSALDALLEVEALPASVTTVNLAGEALERRLVDRVQASGVDRVFNLYGPSECTTYATWSRVAVTPEAPLIGQPVAGSTAHVLSPAGQVVPLGVVGELFLGGAGVARGYFGQPARTAEVFVPDELGGERGSRLYRTGDLARRLPTGELAFLGRRDHQVKIRGFRIEPGEIEQALMEVPGVRTALVLPLAQHLCAFVVLEAEVALASSALVNHLEARLPSYLVLKQFLFLESLPQTPNGKVDRLALGEMARQRRPAADAREGVQRPRSPVEAALVEIWRDVLGVEQVGIGENFFALGGHSLLGVRMIARIRATLGRDLPLAALFEEPTIVRLARRLEGERSLADGEPEPLPRDRPLPLSFAQERLWFLDQMVAERAVYNMPAAVRWRGVLEPAVLREVLVALVARHESLRTVFVEVEGEPRQKILPLTPSPAELLPQVDLRTLPAERRTELALSLARDAGRWEFDLAVRSCRFLLVTLGEQEHLLLLTLHHIIADGASLSVLWRDLAAGYRSLAQGKSSAFMPAASQPADFATWQRRWAAGGAGRGPAGLVAGAVGPAAGGLGTARGPCSADPPDLLRWPVFGGPGEGAH